MFSRCFRILRKTRLLAQFGQDRSDVDQKRLPDVWFNSSGSTDLDTIQNSGIQIATGAFCTSSTASLNCEPGQLSLHFRTEILTANFLTAILDNPIPPINELLFNSHRQNQTALHAPNFTINIKNKFESLFPPLSSVYSNPPPWLF